MKQNITKICLSLMVASSILLADEAKSNAEIGWRFGEFGDSNSSKTPKTQKEILAKMLKVQEEQLVVQKDILKVLKDRFAPEPETIIVNGKPCIANSSAECYKWIPEPEAMRYPVIKDFFSSPTTEKAAKYMQWYSKHTNNASKAGIALYMAKYQYGENATNFNIKKTGMLGSRGQYSQAEGARKKELFIKYSKEFYLNCYIGRNLEVDVFGLKGIAQLMKDIPEIKINLIYYNDDVKRKIASISKKYSIVKTVIEGASAEYSDSKMFKENGIYSTPTLEIVLNKDKSSQIIGTGRVSPTGMVSKVLKYLWFKEVITDSAYVTDYKMWDNSKFLENSMYEDFGKIFDLSKYKYNNTKMKPKSIK